MKLKSSLHVILILLACTVLSGCSSAGLFVWNSSLKLGADHQQIKDIRYGDAAWQKLDLHVPESADSSALPVLIFFYGGSWDSGSKEMYFFYANTFARLGYLVVIPDYAKWPDARFPTFMHDGATTVAWTRENIAEYGGDPEKILLSGHSAGAHLGALLLSDERYLAKHGLQARDVKAFAGLSGPYNFTPTAPRLVEIFGPPENFPNMQVNTHVNGDEPPMLLLHGGDDGTVGVENQQALLNKLEDSGIPAQGVVYPKLGHVGMLLSMRSTFNRNNQPVQDKHRFFQSILRQQDEINSLTSRANTKSTTSHNLNQSPSH